ncbi:hypothetical protein NDU88_000072 [Pleurodeles waltl]|uniref:Uncharacterized protein n=1 Tax=Pleurodeles waltl TaxID=8319 RepID=A0AAV7WIJ0_PLEWA|nr:hypothetical protein NDU88_000072 [Pleurodeles waltl]
MIPGAEGISNDPGENGTEKIGNPDDRIPVSLPGRPTEEKVITIPGNLDIRVSDGIERKDGLRARGGQEKKTSRRKERNTEVAQRKDPTTNRRKNRRRPVQRINPRDGKVLRNLNGATSQEGRGSARYGPT